MVTGKKIACFIGSRQFLAHTERPRARGTSMCAREAGPGKTRKAHEGSLKPFSVWPASLLNYIAGVLRKEFLGQIAVELDDLLHPRDGQVRQVFARGCHILF